jgi:hypothetical protein
MAAGYGVSVACFKGDATAFVNIWQLFMSFDLPGMSYVKLGG